MDSLTCQDLFVVSFCLDLFVSAFFHHHLYSLARISTIHILAKHWVWDRPSFAFYRGCPRQNFYFDSQCFDNGLHHHNLANSVGPSYGINQPDSGQTLRVRLSQFRVLQRMSQPEFYFGSQCFAYVMCFSCSFFKKSSKTKLENVYGTSPEDLFYQFITF